MSKYNQTIAQGEVYTRAKRVICSNPLEGSRQITFIEEDVVTVGDKTMMTDAGQISQPFTNNNGDTEFPLVNPLTGEDLGQTVTFQQLYVLLHSLYISLATKRDESLVEDETE